MARYSNQIGGCASDRVRTTEEITQRALSLGAAVARSFDAPRKEVIAFVEGAGLLQELTPSEHSYIYASRRSAQQTVNMSWNSEALTVLLWSIGKLVCLPGPDAQCSTGDLSDALPPYGNEPLDQFRETARRRSERVLFEMAQNIQLQHVVARQRKSNTKYRPDFGFANVEIVQERHRAINWVVGYCAQDWDEVTADT
ncbi:MAG: DUF4272 domain-containing protein [Comamonadaceae bacterium]|nr:MAG: DUF4272 domain-containing protein [Comamonadaceae bacterium]